MGSTDRGGKKKKKDRMGITKIVYLFGALVFLFAALIAVQEREGYKAIDKNLELHNFTQTALGRSNISLESIDESAKIRLSIEGDFPDGRQGTFFTRLRVNLGNIVANYGRIPKYMVFFESKTVPRLAVRYNLHDSTIEGGLPLIRSTPVEFLSPEFHNVTYTFKEGSQQMIFFDGLKVAEGPYEGPANLMTGMAVLDLSATDFGIMALEGTSSVTGDYLPIR